LSSGNLQQAQCHERFGGAGTENRAAAAQNPLYGLIE